MRLVKISDFVSPEVAEMLHELGDGINGFSGTSFARGEATLDEFLQSCRQGEDPRKAPPGFVAQTVFCVVDDRGHAVGMVRTRHMLTERLLQSGGNIGYYIRPRERGKGYAKQALTLAAAFLKQKGLDRALVTTHPPNAASIAVALASGGTVDEPGRNPDSGEPVNRYWITSP